VRVADAATQAVPEGAPVASVDAYPAQVLTPELLYQFLITEIAGQRGMVTLARDSYIELARKTRDPRVAQRAAEVAIYSRDLDGAVEATRIWLQADPGSEKATQTLAALLVSQGQVAEAAPYLAKLLDASAPATSFMHLQALIGKSRDSKAVLDVVRQLAAGYPSLPEAQYAIARAAQNAGRADEAVAALVEADRLRPGWESAALLRAQILARQSRNEALAYLKDFVAKYPAAHDVRLGYARMLVSGNQMVEARAQFEQLTRDMPEQPDVLLAAGLLSLQTGQFADAERLLGRAQALGPRDEDTVRYYLAQTADEARQDELALKRYREVETGEYRIASRSRQAAILARQGKLPEARALLRSTPAESDGERIQLLQAEAGLLRDAREDAEVFALLSASVKEYPDAIDLLYDRAMAAEKVGQLKIMEDDLRKVIRIKPDYAHAYNALGYTLADRTSRLDEAADLLNKALALAPDDPFILDSIGWLNYRQGNTQKAQEYLERAYALRADPEIAAHLGEVLWAKGSQTAARDLWKAALRNNPDNAVLLGVMRKFNP
jgi:tetratricopeptide (TPR) repeat protein